MHHKTDMKVEHRGHAIAIIEMRARQAVKVSEKKRF